MRSVRDREHRQVGNRSHWAVPLAHEGVELVAGCDMDPAGLKAAAQAYASVNVVLGSEESSSQGEPGRRTLELLDAVYRSAAENGAVDEAAGQHVRGFVI